MDRLILVIDFEITKLDLLMKDGTLEEKFKYLMIGKINGMIEALRLMK